MRLTVPPQPGVGHFLAFAIVDPEVMLEHAEIAVGEPVIAQRRAAGLDGVVEHRLDAFDQPSGAFVRRAVPAGDRRGHALGRQQRAMQRLADVNVAESGDQRWSNSAALRLVFLPLTGARQHGRVECVAERLRTEPAQQRLGVELLPRHEFHRAEAARIVEGHDRAGRHVKYDVVVRERAWRARGNSGRPAGLFRETRKTSRTCRDA